MSPCNASIAGQFLPAGRMTPCRSGHCSRAFERWVSSNKPPYSGVFLISRTTAFGRKQLSATLKNWLDERPLSGEKQLLTLTPIRVNLLRSFAPISYIHSSLFVVSYPWPPWLGRNPHRFPFSVSDAIRVAFNVLSCY